jgi:DNA polymerase III alpha subunit (gram-positive type)
MRIKGIAWVDLETSGFCPKVHEIIEIAVIRTEFAPGLPEVARYEGKCWPIHPETADPKAFEVNGYTREKWEAAGARDLRDTLQGAAPLLEDCVIGGHNAPFDKPFLEAAWAGFRWECPWDYHLMDTASMAMPLWIAGIIRGVSLAKLCAHFGVTNARPHEAMSDIEATVEIARRMMG